MKIETIENEKKRPEWPVPCLVVDNKGTIVMIDYLDNYGTYGYGGFVIKPENGDKSGDRFDGIHPDGVWTLYDGKVILSNN